MGHVCFPVILKSWAGQCEKLLPKKKTHEVLFCAFFVGTSHASTWFICYPFVHSISYLRTLNCLPSWLIITQCSEMSVSFTILILLGSWWSWFVIPGEWERSTTEETIPFLFQVVVVDTSCRISFGTNWSHLVCIITLSAGHFSCSGYRLFSPVGF